MIDLPCPACGRPATTLENDARPFCSRGCQDRDLLAWLAEDYRLPGQETHHAGLDKLSERD